MKKNGTLKEHFKMYKAGKVWLFAAVIGLTLGAGAQSVSGLMTLPGFPTAIKASADDGTRPYWFGQNVDYFKHYNETPDKTTVPESTQDAWQAGKTANEIASLKSDSQFTYDSLTYDQSTGKFTMSLTFKVPTLATNGASRSSYFDLAFSQSLTSKIKSTPSFTAASGSHADLNFTNNVYSNSFNAGSTVGGTSKMSLVIDPVKITSSDQITGMFSSDTGTTGYHPIFSVVRTLGYNDFGNAFNTQLLNQLKINSNGKIDNLNHLNDDQKNDFHNQINNENTNNDFVNDLDNIDKKAADADSNAAGLVTAKTAAKAAVDQAATNAKAKIDGMSGLTDDQKKAAKAKIDADDAAADKNIDNATDTDGINNAQTNGINQINSDADNAQAKADAKSAIDSAATDAKNTIDNTPGLSDTDKTNAKNKVDQDEQTLRLTLITPLTVRESMMRRRRVSLPLKRTPMMPLARVKQRPMPRRPLIRLQPMPKTRLMR
ncbi:DUF1542 domain-containing protein [Fructobacillus papyrifericola]|uniref:DUF1542 domain-containing protein n=1 Tax=Fructobacillus papyrifericola TaxID=2713172 RepID=A0ABS5QRL7_9LACO|nr:DUF1542 domain-containing protein [Fructobacillus papyrifericola]MBS9335844.1 DUF1542 domain-containing protein [Fructobacillus papyrifericola]